MTLKDLLGYPLEDALAAARAAGLRVDRVVLTRARGSERLRQEEEGGFEKRVISCGGDHLVAGLFRTALKEERAGEETSDDE